MHWPCAHNRSRQITQLTRMMGDADCRIVDCRHRHRIFDCSGGIRVLSSHFSQACCGKLNVPRESGTDVYVMSLLSKWYHLMLPLFHKILQQLFKFPYYSTYVHKNIRSATYEPIDTIFFFFNPSLTLFFSFMIDRILTLCVSFNHRRRWYTNNVGMDVEQIWNEKTDTETRGFCAVFYVIAAAHDTEGVTRVRHVFRHPDERTNSRELTDGWMMKEQNKNKMMNASKPIEAHDQLFVS